MQEGQPTVVKSTPYASPMYNYGSSIILLTNPSHELYKMELAFRSMVIGKDNKPVSTGDPLLNELGISSVIGQVQALVNQVTIMSNLKGHEIPAIIDFLGDTLAKDLMVNRTNYDINNASARDKIYFTALSTGFICMKRAYEGDDKRFWKGSQQEITNRVVGQEHNQGGVIKKFLGW